MGFASVAQGAIAGGGAQFSTNRPDVTSATINKQLITTRVQVCFDVAVILSNPGVVPAGLQLTGVDVRDADLRSPNAVTTDPTNTSCILLTFDPAVNEGSYTVLEIPNDLVKPAGGPALGNIESAVQLDGSDVKPVIGRIGGPNLISSIAVDTGGANTGRVQYTFDKNIEDVDPSLFGYFGPSGEFELGDTVIDVDGGSVLIEFTGLVGDDPTPVTATRFFALQGAVDLADRSDAPPGPNENQAEAIGGAVPGRPTLIGASEVAGQQGVYDLQYDQQINGNNNDDCRASLSVGDSYPATNRQVIGNGSVLRVTFGGLTPGGGADVNSDDEVVRITDRGVATGGLPADESFGCAEDRNSARGSVTSSIAIRLGDNIPGFTSGPDLTGCTGSPNTNEVTFRFDELLSNLVGLPDASDFEIKGSDGGSQDGLSIRDRTDTTVTVLFAAGAFPLAAACHIERGTVFDRDPVGGFDFNPSGTVKFNSDGGAPIGLPASGGTVTTVTVPVNVPGPATPGPTTNTNTNTTTTVPGANVATGVIRRLPQSLSLRVRCIARGGGKYSCTATGRLRQDDRVRALGRSKACTGSVKIQYKSGTKTVSTRLARIGNSCTYRKSVNFNKPERLRSGLKAQARYNGNRFAKPKLSRTVVIIRR